MHILNLMTVCENRTTQSLKFLYHPVVTYDIGSSIVSQLFIYWLTYLYTFNPSIHTSSPHNAPNSSTGSCSQVYYLKVCRTWPCIVLLRTVMSLFMLFTCIYVHIYMYTPSPDTVTEHYRRVPFLLPRFLFFSKVKKQNCKDQRNLKAEVN